MTNARGVYKSLLGGSRSYMRLVDWISCLTDAAFYSCSQNVLLELNFSLLPASFSKSWQIEEMAWLSRCCCAVEMLHLRFFGPEGSMEWLHAWSHSLKRLLDLFQTLAAVLRHVASTYNEQVHTYHMHTKDIPAKNTAPFTWHFCCSQLWRRGWAFSSGMMTAWVLQRLKKQLCLFSVASGLFSEGSSRTPVVTLAVLCFTFKKE